MQFRSPRTLLGEMDVDTTAQLIAAAGDIALILDRQGVIRDLALGNDDLSGEGYEAWLGRPWIETVTIESQPKVERLLEDAAARSPLKWRQVNHPSTQGLDVPVSYLAMVAGEKGRVVAIGRDLKAMSAIQQRLVDAQQSMEREYARFRHAETRYRLLFHVTSEPVMVVDASTYKVVEANPAAAELLGRSGKRTTGWVVPEGLSEDSAARVMALLASVRASGRSGETLARLAQGDDNLLVSASLFRQERQSHFLMRLSSPDRPETPRSGPSLSRVVESLPDGFVVTGADFRIITANSAFLDLVQLATEEQARDQPLERWLGRLGVDLQVLGANLRQHGSVRNFGTVLRGEYGTSQDVELSAVSVPDGEQTCLGLSIRAVNRAAVKSFPARSLPKTIEQLTEIVGRMSLKDMVRETTEVIERLSIEAALELTGDNRASAAEMLGLSRQSLYVKLRRYGLGELDDIEGAGASAADKKPS